MPQRDKGRQMDMQKYLQRINYDGPIENQAATLDTLCACHYSHVPFENLDLFGGPRRSMNPAKIYQKIVEENRGGICCELNILFAWLLKEIGFQVELVENQIFLQKTKTFDRKLEHSTLLVTCNHGEKFFVNLSGFYYNFPLAVVDMKEQVRKSGALRLKKQDNDVYLLEKKQKQCFSFAGKEITKPHTEDDWQLIQKIDTTPRQAFEFQAIFDDIVTQRNCFTNRNTVCRAEREMGFTLLWGMTVYRKEYVDHCTEKVVSVVTANDQEELKMLLKNFFKILIDYDIEPCSFDFTKEHLEELR
ncbi:unnamed protein product [Clavelina lepadiformis]|uniref:arylamine N-acetyltransferase n=1 Tax=Clavelina lepadiformis TaxID=159417 RepID=A0ABP0G2L6_CLALP